MAVVGAYSSNHGKAISAKHTNGIKIMERTIISLALATLLAACGSGSDAQSVALGQQHPAEQVAPVAPEQQAETPRIEEEPISEREAKYLHVGVARTVVEYKMIGEPLKAELASEMGGGVDAWIEAEVERCIPDALLLIADKDTKAADAKAMCMGQAYGYWALVNGASGTEGSPRQCLEKGYCGYLFKQFDLNSPSIDPLSGIDNLL